MNTFTFTDQEHRLFEMGGGFIAIEDGMVNLDDLLNAQPGAIVRCLKPPKECIEVFYGTQEPFGCVAGWVSEE